MIYSQGVSFKFILVHVVQGVVADLEDRHEATSTSLTLS